jgi:hypothetical protein
MAKDRAVLTAERKMRAEWAISELVDPFSDEDFDEAVVTPGGNVMLGDLIFLECNTSGRNMPHTVSVKFEAIDPDSHCDMNGTAMRAFDVADEGCYSIKCKPGSIVAPYAHLVAIYASSTLRLSNTHYLKFAGCVEKPMLTEAASKEEIDGFWEKAIGILNPPGAPAQNPYSPDESGRKLFASDIEVLKRVSDKCE